MKKIIRRLIPSFYKDASEVKRHIKYLYMSHVDPKKYEMLTKKQYKKQTGIELDFNNLRTYTEKMQYSKLYKNTPIKTQLTDKFEVREWVKRKVGHEYLIPLLGVWNNFSEVEFEKLPNKFILKANHGAGWNIIVKEKNDVNCSEMKKKFDKWMKQNYVFNFGIEPHYKDIQPRIIAEKYLQDKNGMLNDFKFLCFNGNVYYCWIDVDRFGEHKRNVYNIDWELQPWTQHTYQNFEEDIPKPQKFEEMIKIAEKLSEGFSHVRVDLYNVDGRIFFGEMTFTNSSGFELIYPEEFNLMLGNLWDLNQKEVTQFQAHPYHKEF